TPICSRLRRSARFRSSARVHDYRASVGSDSRGTVRRRRMARNPRCAARCWRGLLGVFCCVSAVVVGVGSTATVAAAVPVDCGSDAQGQGFLSVTADGNVFSFGSATLHGTLVGRHLNAPIRGIASTSSGRGYWLVGSDGGIFAFGDAHFYGSTGGIRLN